MSKTKVGTTVGGGPCKRNPKVLGAEIKRNGPDVGIGSVTEETKVRRYGGVGLSGNGYV